MKFPIAEKCTGQLAKGSIIKSEVVSYVELRFMNRCIICNAMVLQGDNEVLLGAIPLEAIDMYLPPKSKKLTVNPDHPYFAQMKLK